MGGASEVSRAQVRHALGRWVNDIGRNGCELARVVHDWANRTSARSYYDQSCSQRVLHALEAEPHGIRVNCVAPSLAMHPFLQKVSTQEFLDSLIGLEAFNRPAETWEIANVMVFLASEYSSYMTGEEHGRATV